MITVLVVDDSAFIRKALTMMLESDPEIKVIGHAAEGSVAVKKVKELNPDVITLDLDMQGLDGLNTLKQIMIECPTPVLIVSSLARDGSKITLDALQIGAVDFILKETSLLTIEVMKIQRELVEKVKVIGSKPFLKRYKDVLNLRYLNPLSKLQIPLEESYRTRLSVVAIGTSTGGPPALQAILPSLPQNLPVPIFIVQHMPPGFTKHLAERLNGLSEINVVHAEDEMMVNPGYAYLAPGYAHMTVVNGLKGTFLHISDEPKDAPHIPSIDVLFESVAIAFPKQALGIILTGMGSDGLKGAYKMKELGCTIITEKEETCVVYGMPRAVYEADLSDIQLSLTDIPQEIMRQVTQSRRDAEE